MEEGNTPCRARPTAEDAELFAETAERVSFELEALKEGETRKDAGLINGRGAAEPSL